ncbi:hypothetical protein Ciccas_003566, partial [Cichlidogyrus casuarinus]
PLDLGQITLLCSLIVSLLKQVTDRDLEDRGRVQCYLGPDDNFSLEQDSAETGALMFVGQGEGEGKQSYRLLVGRNTARSEDTAQYLDREQTPYQNVTITCQDKAHNVARKTIEIELTDVNDNAPKFSRDVYKFELAENTPFPANELALTLGPISATDLDIGRNAEIVYGIISEASNLFDIDASSGYIRVYQEIDRERGPADGVYSFKVTATDQGLERQFTSTATVNISIKDVNDCKPEFSQESYQFEVFENLKPGSLVGIVRAVDRDAEATNHSIHYSLSAVSSDGFNPSFYYGKSVSPMSYMNHFAIDRISGKISLKASLDREQVDNYLFFVVAVDSPLSAGGARLTSTVTVNIVVEDVNDNAPTIVRLDPDPLDTQYTINDWRLSLQLMPGNTLVRCQATDADQGPNAQLDHFPTVGLYRFLINVCDHGSPAKCTKSPEIQFTIVDGPVQSALFKQERIANQNDYGEESARFQLVNQNDPLIGGRKNLTLLLCMVIICVTFVLAGSLLVCLLKKRYTRSDFDTTSHGWKDFFLGSNVGLRRVSESATSGNHGNFLSSLPYENKSQLLLARWC